MKTDIDVSIIKRIFSVPCDFLHVLYFKVTHHKGKFSFFKSTLILIMLGYLLFQPWTIVRSALASAFTGYMLNNTTNNVLDTFAEMDSM